MCIRDRFCILAIPSAFTYTLGKMTGSPRHGWAVWAAMALLFLAGVTTAYWAEARGNPLVASAAQHSLQHPASALHATGNLEGKEVRFGVANSALFATVTTDTSCGAVNSLSLIHILWASTIALAMANPMPVPCTL